MKQSPRDIPRKSWDFKFAVVFWWVLRNFFKTALLKHHSGWLLLLQNCMNFMSMFFTNNKSKSKSIYSSSFLVVSLPKLESVLIWSIEELFWKLFQNRVPFSVKFQAYAMSFTKKELYWRCFPCILGNSSKNSFFTEHLRVTTFVTQSNGISLQGIRWLLQTHRREF